MSKEIEVALAYSRQQWIDHLRIRYPEGTRIELVSMDDPQAPPMGTRGTVLGVDSAGDVLVIWDNGCTLNLVPNVDHWQKLTHLDN